MSVGDGSPFLLPVESGTARSRRLTRWRSRRAPMIKRSSDLLAVTVTAPLWVPLLAILIFVVKVAEPRQPAIFRQWRLGVGGRPFRILKIRTMVPNAEILRDQLAEQNEVGGPQFKMRNDPRVTRLGRLLRRTHLDELPQLLNILVGEMSLVGPRPAEASIDVYSHWWKARLQCRPGLTGLWQVRRLQNGDFDDRARLDIAYVRNWSMMLDLRIIAETVIVAFVRRSGA